MAVGHGPEFERSCRMTAVEGVRIETVVDGGRAWTMLIESCRFRRGDRPRQREGSRRSELGDGLIVNALAESFLWSGCRRGDRAVCQEDWGQW